MLDFVLLVQDIAMPNTSHMKAYFSEPRFRRQTNFRSRYGQHVVFHELFIDVINLMNAHSTIFIKL